MRGPTGSDDHRPRSKYIEITGADVEADGPCDAIGFARIHQQMGDHDAVIDLGGGFARGFCFYGVFLPFFSQAAHLALGGFFFPSEAFPRFCRLFCVGFGRDALGLICRFVGA